MTRHSLESRTVERTQLTLTTIALLDGTSTVASATTAPTVSVLLITGDHVLIAPSGQVNTVAGEGHEGTAFTIRRGGHTYVIPADALPLVTNGALDRQLYDVAMLEGEDYGANDNQPLIVQGDGAVPRAGDAQIAENPDARHPDVKGLHNVWVGVGDPVDPATAECGQHPQVQTAVSGTQRPDDRCRLGYRSASSSWLRRHR